MRTSGEEKIHSKVANCFYLKVPGLVNPTNQHFKKSEITIILPSKRKLQQNQKNVNKPRKNEIKPKQKKIETKTTSKKEIKKIEKKQKTFV